MGSTQMCPLKIKGKCLRLIFGVDFSRFILYIDKKGLLRYKTSWKGNEFQILGN